MPGRWESVTVDGSAMRLYLSVPASPGPHPGVLVIQHYSGVDDFIQTMTGQLANAGYAALAPDLYHREDLSSGDDWFTRMGRLRDEQVIPDVNAAAEFLQRNAAQGRPIGITGFCMGGRVAYLMAAVNPAFQATVVFYGGNITTPWGYGQAPIDLTRGIRGPVLGLFGQDDANPSPADVAELDAELTRFGIHHEFHSYPGAGHAFMTPGRPAYRPYAALDAWPRTLAWFDSHLGGSTVPA